MQINNKLVQTTTSDDYILSGLLFEAQNSDTAIIYIHGFTSDPYTHLFPKSIALKVKDLGYTTLFAQNRGTGIITEFLKTSRIDRTYIGSYYELIEDAHLDITAWIKYLKEIGFKKFILMGHSLGTIKAIRYLFEGEYKSEIQSIILLGPFDKNWFILQKAKDKREEHLKLSERMIQKGKGRETVTPDMEDFLISYQTYYSWYNTSELSCMFDFYRIGEYDFPTLQQIKIPTFVALGSKDETDHKEINDFEVVFKKYIKDIDYHLIEGSGHWFVGYEEVVSNLVSNFLQNQHN